MIIVAHSEEPLIRGVDGYVGSPMYGMLPEHGLAVVLFGGFLVLSLWLRRRARRGQLSHAGIRSAWMRLEPEYGFLGWLLAASSVIHLGLLLGHEPSGYSVLYAVATVAFGVVAYRLVTGKPWRRWTRLVLLGSILGYAASSASGSVPDQIGMATKVLELVALAIALNPRQVGRVRRAMATAGTVGAVTIVGLGAWIGALGAGAGGHHLGEVPPPGVLLPTGEDRPATAHEAREAKELHAATVAALTRWQNPAEAARAGFDVNGISGLDFHAVNPRFKNDGVVLDPERPENLIYAVGPDGPVLVGAMFEAEGIGVAGPAVGGPLTVWHAHDHVCFGLTPPSLAGLVSPFGTCPLGALALPLTNEMLHVWVVPGAPQAFGDLDESWLKAYLRGEMQAGGQPIREGPRGDAGRPTSTRTTRSTPPSPPS